MVVRMFVVLGLEAGCATKCVGDHNGGEVLELIGPE
jgi:hypothetical protein